MAHKIFAVDCHDLCDTQTIEHIEDTFDMHMWMIH